MTPSLPKFSQIDWSTRELAKSVYRSMSAISAPLPFRFLHATSVGFALMGWPELAAFLSDEPSFPGMPMVRALTSSAPDAAGISLGQRAKIASGIPK